MHKSLTGSSQAVLLQAAVGLVRQVVFDQRLRQCRLDIALPHMCSVFQLQALPNLGVAQFAGLGKQAQ